MAGKKGARLPPKHLQDLRKVYRGLVVSGPGADLLRKLREDDPGKFLAELRAAERDWQLGRNKPTTKAATEPKPSALPSFPAVVDAGEERIEAAIERFLKEMAT